MMTLKQKTTSAGREISSTNGELKVMTAANMSMMASGFKTELQ